MKHALPITHLMMILGAVVSIASVSSAQNLCRSVLLTASSQVYGPVAVESAIKELAKLKLFIDTRQTEGDTSSVVNEARRQFELKKNELQKLTGLPDSDLTKAIRQEVVRAQEESNVMQKEETARRLKQDIKATSAVKKKTIELGDGMYNDLQDGHISEKNDLAVHTSVRGQKVFSVLNLKNGTLVNHHVPPKTSLAYLPKNSDVAVLQTDSNIFSTMNLFTGVRREWTAYNQWLNTIETGPKTTSRARTLSYDQKFLIFAHKYESDELTHIGVFEIATGKLVRKIDLSGIFDFGMATMIHDDILFLSALSDRRIYTVNLQTEKWTLQSEYFGRNNINKSKSEDILVGSTNENIYTYDIAAEKVEVYHGKLTRNFIGLDHEFAYQVLENNSVRQLSLPDLRVVAETFSHGNQTSEIHVSALKSGVMLGQFIDGVTPLAIYNNRNLDPIFKFDDIYEQPNIRIDSATVIHDGTEILVQYKVTEGITYDTRIDIWKVK